MREHAPLLCGVLLSVGCTPADDSDTTATLPTDTDSVEYLEEDSWIDTDTGISGAYTDEEPLHSLTMTHTGQWDLLPLGGPFTSMVGELVVTELLDGDELVPWCKVTFSLTGQAVDEVCPTCDFGFLILFYLSDEGDKKDPEVGGREDCQSPQLPEDGETRVLAYSEAESLLYFNYYGTDIWVPWYEAAQFRDELNYEWTDTAGFIGVEEEDE